MDDGGTFDSTISINALRKSVTETIDLKRTNTFNLQSAVVDHDIITHTLSPISTSEVNINEEYVAFAIIETAYTQISG